MGRFAISGTTSIAGSATLPNVSLYATAAVTPSIREVGLWNTTTASVIAGLTRLSSTGTQGSGLTEVAIDDPVKVAIATGFAGHSSTGPTLAGEVRSAVLGAAIGSGIIWTFGGRGLIIPAGTSNGVGVYVPSGTGQVLRYYIEWEE